VLSICNCHKQIVKKYFEEMYNRIITHSDVSGI
jgi:hypothetical protein